MLYDVFSLWEIAHRWHGEDPNVTDPKALPLTVQDTLRWLTRMMWRHELRICSKKGVEHDNANDQLSYRDFIKDRGYDEDDNADLSEEEKRAEYESYLDWHEARIKFHSDSVEGFDKCFEGRVYDKEKLDHIFSPKHGLAELCQVENIPLPEFWFPGGAKADNPEEEQKQKLRNDQLDKQLCQAIARTLWSEHPDMTIADLIQHPSIVREGNGRIYTPKTIRRWLSPVDPRSASEKTGRPKKK